MTERGEATRGAYAADAAPASRLALPSSVREETPRKAALTLPGVPLDVVERRPGASPVRLAAGPCAPPEVLVAELEVEVGALRPVEVPTPVPEVAVVALPAAAVHARLLPVPVAARLLREGGAQGLGVAALAAQVRRVGARLAGLPPGGVACAPVLRRPVPVPEPLVTLPVLGRPVRAKAGPRATGGRRSVVGRALAPTREALLGETAPTTAALAVAAAPADPAAQAPMPVPLEVEVGLRLRRRPAAPTPGAAQPAGASPFAPAAHQAEADNARGWKIPPSWKNTEPMLLPAIFLRNRTSVEGAARVRQTIKRNIPTPCA